MYVGYCLFAVLALLVFLVLVYALFDEYPFERCEVELFSHLSELYLKLLPENRAGVLHIVAQHIAHPYEVGFLLRYDAAVGRHRHLAVRERVQGVDGAVA